MAIAGEIVARLRADTGNFIAGLAVAGRETSSFASTTSAAMQTVALASARASEAAKRLEVAQAQAAAAMKRAETMVASAGASAEQIAVAQAKAALAAEKVKVSEVAAATAMQRASEAAQQEASSMNEDASATEKEALATSQAERAHQGFHFSLSGSISSIMSFGAQLGQCIYTLRSFYDGAIGIGKALLSQNASMEQTQIAFTTLMGSSKQATVFLKQLQSFAAATPLEFPQIATAAQHMMAFGFSARDVIPTLTDVGDAMSSMGKGSESIDHIIEIFGQMQAAGKVNAQDMRQFASEGIPAWKYLAQAMHLSVAQVQDLSQRGLLPADKAIAAIRAGMHATFGGGMQREAMSFNGLLSTFRDNIGNAWRAFTGPLFNMAKSGLTQIGALVSSPAFQKFATDMGAKVGGALRTVGGIIQKDVWPVMQRMFAVWNSSPGQAFVSSLLQLGKAALDLLMSLGQLSPLFVIVTSSMRNAGSPSALFATILTRISQIIRGVVIPAIQQYTGFIRSLIPIVTPIIQSMYSIFLQVFSGIGQVVKMVAPVVMGQLLPALGSLMKSIYTLIGPIIQWIAASGVIPVIFTIIGTVLRVVVQVLAFLISTVATIITWLSQFRGILLVVGAVLLTIFAPVIAIVAALIAGLILVVKNWGNITSWLQGVWNGFLAWIRGVWTAFTTWFGSSTQAVITFFKNLWQGIVGFFTGLWTQITTGVKNGLQGIATGATTAWHGIQTAFLAGVTAVKNVVLGGFQAIGSLFTWLYNHNYYIKALCDTIRAYFFAAIVWIQSSWKSVTTWLASTWNGLVSTASSVWRSISSAVTSAVSSAVNWLRTQWSNATSWVTGQWNRLSSLARNYFNMISAVVLLYVQMAVNWLRSQWTAAVSWLQGKWNQMMGLAQAAWQRVSSVFASAWSTYIVGPLTSLAGNIQSWFSNLASQAWQSGSNLVHSIADGISSGAGAVWDAVKNVAAQIWKALGFHSPSKEGPGRTADKWMPALIRMVSGGLLAGRRQVAAAAQAVAEPLTMLNTPIRPSVRPSFSASAGTGGMGLSGSARGQTIILEVDGHVLTQIVNRHTDEQVRLKLGARGRIV